MSTMRIAARKRPAGAAARLRPAAADDRRTREPDAGRRRSAASAGRAAGSADAGSRLVRLTGRVEPARGAHALLAGADVYVAPAILESFGLAALEARSVGLPVVGLSRHRPDRLRPRRRRGSALRRRRRAWSTRCARCWTTTGSGDWISEHNRTVASDLTWARALVAHERLYARAARRRDGAGAMSPGRPDRFTLVAFHAHPDDEVLLTGGLLARAAAEGHRVVLVTATAGERGLAGRRTAPAPTWPRRRSAELAESAALLGCTGSSELGYRDSGLRPDPDDTDAFAHAGRRRGRPVAWPCCSARSRRTSSRSTTATVATATPTTGRCTGSATLAARLAGTPVVLEATVPGRLFGRVLRLLALVGHPLGRSAPLGTAGSSPAADEITHRVGVASVARPQARGDGRTRVAAAWRRTSAAPRPLRADAATPVRLVFGREWYVEQGRPGPSRLDDVFASLRCSTPYEDDPVLLHPTDDGDLDAAK